MRFVVFLLGLVASLLTGAAGVALMFWDSWADKYGAGMIDPAATTSMTGIAHANAGLILVVAACYGLLGALFVLVRCGKQGGLLMVIPVLGGAFMNPLSLIFSGLQLLAGLLSFLVGPLPIAPPQSDDD